MARGFSVSEMIHYAACMDARGRLTETHAPPIGTLPTSTGSLSRLHVSRIEQVACPLHCSCGTHNTGALTSGTQSAADCCYWCYCWVLSC